MPAINERNSASPHDRPLRVLLTGFGVSLHLLALLLILIV